MPFFFEVSRAATKHINNVLINYLFNAHHPLANIPCDLSNGMIDIHPVMQVLLTQNRDKNNVIVNEQMQGCCKDFLQ